MRIRRLFSILAPLALVASLAAAQSPDLVPVGGEIRVNTTTAEAQFAPDVAMDDAGNFVVVWSGGPRFGNREIFAQRYDASGTPLGSEFQVNTFSSTQQSNPRVGMDADGDFIVTWTSRNQFPPAISSAVGQRYDSAGNPVGGEFAISGAEQASTFQDVAMDAAGNFLVVWQARSAVISVSEPVHARLYGSDGTSKTSPFAVASSQETGLPSVTAAPDGSWVVAWDGSSSSGANVLARRLDAGGNLAGPEVVVQTAVGGYRQDAFVAASSDRIVVSWSDYSGSGSAFARLFDDGFSPLTGDFNPSTLPAQPAQESTVAMDGAGRFVIAWVDLEDGPASPARDGSESSILARAFDAAGNPLGSDFVVNTTTARFQALPRLAMSPAGRLVAVWVGPSADFEDDVFAQVYAPNATNAAPEARCRNLTVSAGPSCTAGASIDNGSFDPDGADTITLAQSPAGPYALGATLVTLTVTDNHGAASSCTGTVTVADATPPAISCPAPITADGSLASGGAEVPFTVSATDSCDASVGVVATPPSGSLFPFGTTTVSATATDDSGNNASCSFTVTVLSPQDQIASVVDEIEALIAGGTLASNKANPLISKLEGAAAKLDAAQTGAACNQLGAFQNQVSAYVSNGNLTAAQGKELIDATNAIRANLGC